MNYDVQLAAQHDDRPINRVKLGQTDLVQQNTAKSRDELEIKYTNKQKYEINENGQVNE